MSFLVVFYIIYQYIVPSSSLCVCLKSLHMRPQWQRHVHGTSAIQECEWNPPNRLIWSENSPTYAIYKMVHALRQAKYDLIHLQSLQCKHKYMIVVFKMKNSGTWRCWTQWRFWLYWRYYMWCKWTSLLSYFHLVYILRIHGISLHFLCGYVAQGLLVFDYTVYARTHTHLDIPQEMVSSIIHLLLSFFVILI